MTSVVQLPPNAALKAEHLGLLDRCLLAATFHCLSCCSAETAAIPKLSSAGSAAALSKRGLVTQLLRTQRGC